MTRMMLIAAFALTACMATADETASAADFSKLDWHLVEVDGKVAPWSASINLGEAGQISGQAPCNHYFGPVTRNGDSFVPGAIASTKMACPDLEGETQFFGLLAGITKAELLPGMLILTGGGHQMRFVQPID